MNRIFFNLVLMVSVLIQSTNTGIVGLVAGYGGCEIACNAAWVTCLAAAGVVVGIMTAGAGAPAAVLTCNGIKGVCLASCAATFLVTPTP